MAVKGMACDHTNTISAIFQMEYMNDQMHLPKCAAHDRFIMDNCN